MKLKITTLIVITILSWTTCLAQNEEESTQTRTSKTVIWGIKGNIGAELPYAKWKVGEDSRRMFNSGFGASIGGLANIYLGKNFYFEPELALFYEGYSYNNMIQVTPHSPSINGGPNIHKLGLRMPMVFGYFINISDTWGLNVFTGPELDYAFYGTARAENEDIKDTYDLMHVFKGQYAQSRLEFGWKVGVGFPVNNFLISLEGDLGITDMLKHSLTMRENRVSLGVTYYFVD